MKIKLGLAIVFFVFLAACRSLAPVMDVNNQSFSKGQSLEKIGDSIVTAASLKGWSARVIKPGHIKAQLMMRGKHEAVVDIFYTTEDFSIKYASSYGLKYDGAKIHPNYNRWIHNLRHVITNQLSR